MMENYAANGNMEGAMLPESDQQLQISRLPPDDDQQMLPDDQHLEKSRSSDVEQLEKSLLTDEHRRGILFALEYAMLAILDRSPFPVPPLVTDAYLDKLVRDIKANIPRPVPVPRDWEPSLKLPQKMLDTQNCSQLHSHMFRLQRLINKDIFCNNNGSPYLSEAHTYFSRAEIYLLSG